NLTGMEETPRCLLHTFAFLASIEKGIDRKVRVCSIIGDLRKMKYETQTLSQRPDGRAVGPDRAFAAPGQPPPPGPAPQDRFARGRQRSVLPCPRRMYLASTAPRPAP